MNYIKAQKEVFDALCGFVNYVYSTLSGMTMGTTAIDSDDFSFGKKICKGADGYDETEIQKPHCHD